GCHKTGKRKIPASALVALLPGKASPLVFGGKIHTPNDTADRVYPAPLAESLRIIDYWYFQMHGGPRLREPRDPGEYHYAQLFRVSQTGAQPEEYWLAMKDAIEPNQRNINGLYRVQAQITDGRARCEDLEILDWGVHTRLRHEVEDQFADVSGSAAASGTYERMPVEEIEVATTAGTLRFSGRRRNLFSAIHALAQQALGSFERFMGSNTFLAFFVVAYLLARVFDMALMFVFGRFTGFAEWFFDWFTITLPLTVIVQLSVLLWLIGTRIPTMIDNAYRHLNKADNLRSLSRVSSVRSG
ncbi:MAG: hypothetical protein ACRD2Y_13190, partial [Terriglobales bacterium]